MPREKELTYDWLSVLRESFGADRQLVTLAEAARFLKKDVRTLQRDRTFPVRQMGGRWVVPILNFARWLA